MKAIQKINEAELRLGVGSKSSWHNEYSDSAYVFIGTCVYTCTSSLTYLGQLIFPRKSDCLGCAVLLCLVCLFVCLTLLASFFLPSHLSLKLYTCTCCSVLYIKASYNIDMCGNIYMYMYM